MVNDRISYVSDTIHGTIVISNFEKRIMSTTIFNRLHGISQNSTAFLTFPTNRTKRFEHSVGTMNLCSQIFFYGVSNVDNKVTEKFLKLAQQHIDDTINEIKNKSEYSYKFAKRLKTIPASITDINIHGGIYNFLTPPNVKQEYKNIYYLLLESIRVASLLHDIGHPPFSHITENALNNVVKKAISIDTNASTRLKESLNTLTGTDKQLHEELGISLANACLLNSIKDLTNDKIHPENIFKTQLYEVLIKEFTINILNEKNDFFHSLHRIIDGTLDGDRLDYVTRDPINSGLKAGSTEYDRLVKSIRLCENEGYWFFCPDVKVMSTIDNFISRRLDVYKNIIYHHRVIKTDKLLQDIIEEVSLEYLSDDSKDLEKDSETLIPYDISGLWKAVEEIPSEFEKAEAALQWDDAWLMVVLKKYYFDNLRDSDNNLSYKFREFLKNEKYYYSVIKNKFDFIDIDKYVISGIKDNIELIINKISELKTKSKNIGKDQFVSNIDDYIDKINKLQSDIISYDEDYNANVEGYFLPRLVKEFFIPKINEFSSILPNVKEVFLDKYSNKINDISIVHKKLSLGIKDDLYVSRLIDNEISVLPYSKMSSIKKSIESQMNCFQNVYIYILVKDKNDFKNINYKNIREDVGLFIGEAIVKNILKLLDTKNK